jgi:hypothetical protein
MWGRSYVKIGTAYHRRGACEALARSWQERRAKADHSESDRRFTVKLENVTCPECLTVVIDQLTAQREDRWRHECAAREAPRSVTAIRNRVEGRRGMRQLGQMVGTA